MDFETEVKLEIYKQIVDTTQVPSLDRLASILGKKRVQIDTVRDSLAAKRLLVLEKESGEIRMAPPFSAVPTPHKVMVEDRTYLANCIWDAFGVAAALGADADISTGCADCGEAMAFQVRNGSPVPEPCAIHYAVPAAQWWDDIVFT